MFDGMNTCDPVSGQSNIPLVALNLLGTPTKEEIVGDPLAKRKRVEIEVEFRHVINAEMVTLKQGSTRISDTKWKTFVHVQDESMPRVEER